MNYPNAEIEAEMWINVMLESNNNVTGELSGNANNEEQ